MLVICSQDGVNILSFRCGSVSLRDNASQYVAVCNLDNVHNTVAGISHEWLGVSIGLVFQT